MVYYSNDLKHHGILGQKWGVRRYQNPDGSLTEAGKKRYGISSSDATNDYKNAKFEYKKAQSSVSTSGLGLTKASRQARVDAVNNANIARNKMLEAKGTLKIAKMKEKGKSEEKIQKETDKIELKEAQRNAWLETINEANKKYGELSGVKAFFVGAFNESVDALVSSGYSEAGAKFYTLMMGSNYGLVKAQNRIYKDVKNSYNENKKKEKINK